MSRGDIITAGRKYMLWQGEEEKQWKGGVIMIMSLSWPSARTQAPDTVGGQRETNEKSIERKQHSRNVRGGQW